jgi:hypothetical protein
MPSLPILTLDERVLSPRFGYVFHARWLEPYESIVGMLWKFVRANRLSGAAVIAQIGVGSKDPYEGLEPTARQVDCRVVARLLQVKRSSVLAGMRRETHERGGPFRYCPRCLDFGYHGVIHQVERHSVCPVHRCALHSRCRHCASSSAYRLDAQLLDAPFRCPHCRRCLASTASVSFEAHRGISLKDRVAITRSMLA